MARELIGLIPYIGALVIVFVFYYQIQDLCGIIHQWLAGLRIIWKIVIIYLTCVTVFLYLLKKERINFKIRQ